MTDQQIRRSPLGRVLTIAGSDSGGGAGIQADLKTCTALGCFGMTAITALTAQNTLGVRAILEVPVDHVDAQIAAVYEDIGVDAVKTGMLANAAIIETVASALKKYGAKNIVVDPVMISKSGAALLREDAVETMKKVLLPMATLVCPNIPEAEVLAGMSIDGEGDIGEAVRRLHEMGPALVLLKGGHLQSEDATDYLYDGNDLVTFSAPRIATSNTHGTGCTYSAAIACFLASGATPAEAVENAKIYLTGAILHGGRLDLGRGAGPLFHGWNLERTDNNG